MRARDPNTELAWLDRAGVIVAVNDAWTDFCAANHGDIDRCGVGNSYLDVCNTAGDPRSNVVAAAINAAIRGHLLQPVTVHIPCHSPGGARWFDLTVAPAVPEGHADPAGADSAAVVVGLTPIRTPAPADAPAAPDRELADTAWELVEAAPDGTVVTDGDGRIAYVNRELERLTGYRRDQLLGQRVSTLVPESSRPQHHAWEEAYRSAPRHRMMGAGRPLEILRSDGTTLPVEISLAPVTIGTTSMTAASVRDVSQQRAADTARRQLLHLLDLDPDAVYIVDATTTRIEYANTGAAELLGYSRAELSAMTMYDLTPAASDETRRSYVDEHHRLGPGHRHDVDVARMAKDGTVVPCRTRGQLVTTDQGEEKFVIVDRDARERLALERQRERRDAMSSVVAAVTALVLADAPETDVRHAVVQGIARVLDSDNASLVLLDAAGSPVTTAAYGPIAQLHHSGQVALPTSVVSAWVEHEGPFAVAGPPPEMPDAIRRQAGPGVIARFPNPEPSRGIVTAFRRKGREPFTDADAALLGDFTREVGTVLALGGARADRHRLALLEDRQRIARDLHDLVIQDLISIGMQLQALPATATSEDRELLIDDLEGAIRALRTIVFETGDRPPAERVTDTIDAVIAQSARVLGHRPDVAFTGDVDELDPVLVTQVIATLREGLSNVARHARAAHTSVRVAAADGHVTVEISDDGIGPGRRDLGGTGLSNLGERARRLGGSASLEPRVGGGSTLTWTVSVPT